MDNRRVWVTSEGLDDLKAAVSIMWKNAPGGKATHYRVVKVKAVENKYGDSVWCDWDEAEDGVDTLVLYWEEDSGTTALPFPLKLDGATQFIASWLDSATYPAEPDHDGSNDKGWMVFNDDWGHALGSSYGFLAVQPAWAMYGK